MLSYLKNFFALCLDALFPLSNRVRKVQALKAEDFKAEPLMQNPFGVPITSLLSFNDSRVRMLIHALKFEASHHAASIASDIVADFLIEEIADEKVFSDKKLFLVPVPLGKVRERERGRNQSARITDTLSDTLAIQTAPHLLVRVRETLPQTTLKRKERLQNVQGAFSVPSEYLPEVKDAHIILIDDVTTTGATLSEAAKPLLSVGASVTALSIAHA